MYSAETDEPDDSSVKGMNCGENNRYSYSPIISFFSQSEERKTVPRNYIRVLERLCGLFPILWRIMCRDSEINRQNQTDRGLVLKEYDNRSELTLHLFFFFFTLGQYINNKR